MILSFLNIFSYENENYLVQHRLLRRGLGQKVSEFKSIRVTGALSPFGAPIYPCNPWQLMSQPTSQRNHLGLVKKQMRVQWIWVGLYFSEAPLGREKLWHLLSVLSLWFCLEVTGRGLLKHPGHLR